ncbi:protein translocase subunit SecF [Teredinibacter turnerae]|uniref:Protein-export membrane protein SecF n=1 Tax=Teredinibacter turnerae (strain ATCC 39867 / T7901) TaxID=377629 RepID=C5BLX9_TERTT|nr:protein translocase subunit SecF [Teredinibacter turnerae]ACR14056.1 protein-export membrane protein SecF [Teredinibacter turnerae T7901]
MNEDKVINFMGRRKLAAAFSIALVLISIGSLLVKGLAFGLDFTGGTLIELHYPQSADLGKVRDELGEMGYANAVVANFGSDEDVVIRIQSDGEKIGDSVATQLIQAYGGEEPAQLKRIEYVGSQIGEEFANDGALGMLFALAVVMAYVALRFQFKFSVGAVVALAHDVLIVLGMFSLFQLDFDLTVLASVLAVIGYSLNDTIVVSDRIRENFRKIRKAEPIEVVNISLTQTLDRTLITSGTTMLVLVALFIFGGELIHNFALALLIGIGIGTYSSIYVAANIMLAMNISKDDLIVIEKEGEDQESMMP